MAKNFRTLYLYIISLITLGMIVGGIVGTVNNITAYFYPDSYVFYPDEIVDYDYEDEYDYKYKTKEDATRIYEIRRENYKNEKIKNAVVAVAIIAVGTVMYKYHWSLIEKERKK